MSRKNGLEIKKGIIKALKEKECSLRELETKLNTNHITIKNHCKELEFLKIIEIVKHPKNERNGRPFTTVKLTHLGRNL